MPRKKMQDENDPMVVLARIALQEQADKIETRNRERQSREVALRQMHEMEADERKKRERFQGLCDHLLGNHRIGVKPDKKRSALHKDYLSDKSVRIYCGKCRFDWQPGDRADFYFRLENGKRIQRPNPTKTSWREINILFYSFENSNDLTSRAFRLERVEPEDIDSEEARVIEETNRNLQATG
jgi:parvulin-like peptidyl-prolyl isomerase